MKRAMITSQRCHGCVPCLVEAMCEKKAIIRETPEDKPWVDFYACVGCMKCKTCCPHDAVEEIAQPCSIRSRQSW